MTSSEFRGHLNSILPDNEHCVNIWIDWTRDLEGMDSCDYTQPPGSYKTQAEYLQEFSDIFDQIQSEHGTEVTQQMISLSEIPFCLFPWEMRKAAEHLASGGNVHDIPHLSEEGLLEYFPETTQESESPSLKI